MSVPTNNSATGTEPTRSLKDRFKDTFRPAFHRSTNRLVESLVNYRNRGVINMIDIGSAGLLPEPWIYRPQKIRRLLKFDPLESPSSNPAIQRVSVALWDENTERPFYVYKGLGGTGSSLFPQNYAWVDENFDTLRQRGTRYLAETWHERARVDRELSIECRRLDDVLPEVDPDTRYNFLKVDAQGAESRILQGAEKLLETSCQGLQLELFVMPLYEGIVLMDDVIAWLKERGFDLAKTFKPHGTFHSQNDCLFLKRDGDPETLKVIRQCYGI